MKPYDEIPGPKGFPFIGTALDYAKDKRRTYKITLQRVEQYGKLFKEKMMPGLPELVFVIDPADIEKVRWSGYLYRLLRLCSYSHNCLFNSYNTEARNCNYDIILISCKLWCGDVDGHS